MTVLRLVLLLATVTSGLVAGVYVLYAHTLMPGLRTVDDRTFVTAFGAVDRAILGPWFLLTGFAGAPVLTAAAVALSLGAPDRALLGWVVGALVLHLVVVVLTVRVHVPANDRLKASVAPGEPPADPAAVRTAFDEGRWARWNSVRAVLAVGAFAALCWALVLAD